MAHRYEKREKHTGVGSIVKHIAYCPICNAIVEPKERRTSRRGTHSTIWFEHEHPLSFITLLHSSLGHSSVSFEAQVPDEIKRAVVYLWVWERCDVEDVEEIIKDPHARARALEEMRERARPAPPPPPVEPNTKLLVQTRRRLSSTVFVKFFDARAESVFDMPDCTDAELLASVRDAVAKLEDRFKVPLRFSSGDYCLPRYFLIAAHYDRESARAHVIDIANVRRDKTAGSWSYRRGYWAPLARERILDALDVVLRRAQEERESALPHPL
jgi:hypothetical protein